MADDDEALRASLWSLYDLGKFNPVEVADWMLANRAVVLRALGFPGLAALAEANDKPAERGA